MAKIDYKKAGVDIDAANLLVERIKPHITRTRRAEVLGDIGGFGALFAVPKGRKDPILVASTDGVGTKLKLAQMWNRHETVGIDLVAMCVNDIAVQGAEPLFFLDYFACGKLDVEVAEQVVAGIACGCEMAGCALIGGETAEMPGMYGEGEYDLAGFCVGIVERDRILPRGVEVGDRIIGIASSGPHSNGYSLIRKLIKGEGISPETELAGKPLIEWLLEPTRIYVKPLLSLHRECLLHAAAHITGGGFTENLPRVLPENSKAVIELGSWPVPEIFNWIRERAELPWSETLRTFNCGVGMALVVPEAAQHRVVEKLKELGETAWPIGRIEAAEGKPFVELRQP